MNDEAGFNDDIENWLSTTYLVLDKELDTLDGSCGGLGDGSGNTTHCG